MASHEGQEPCCLCRLCRPGSAVCCLSEECLTPLCVGHVTMVMASVWHHQSQLSPAVWGGGYKACTHSSLPHILLFFPVEYAVGALMAEEDPYHIRGGRDRGGAGGGVICCCVMCTHKWRDCVGAGAVQLIAVLTRCGNSLLRPTDCVCVYICSSLTLIRGSLMSRPVHSSVTHMTCVAGAMCPYLLVAQWGGILLLHQWCARSVGNVLPWRYQLEGAGLCLCILTTVGLVAV